MAQINPYLTFNGNCEDAFSFYKSVFGTEFRECMRFKDMGQAEGLTDEEANRIMHVSMPISKETILMGSDSLPKYGDVAVGQNLSLSVNTFSKEEADKIFNRLAVGGNVTMPMENTFWGAYFGMLVDKYQITWMVNFDVEKPE
ncbi:MAG: VOC family protein [Bacteroidota bacterium]